MAPVCSVSRAAIITGVASFALGTHHHRSRVAAPEHLRLLPAYLRDAGYFTSNCVKTDYNLAGTSNAQSDAPAPLSVAAWNAWSGSAHWRQRRSDQPFFAVFNYTECHSFVTKDSDETILAERLTLLQPDDFHDPEQAQLPPYHPDIPSSARRGRGTTTRSPRSTTTSAATWPSCARTGCGTTPSWCSGPTTAPACCAPSTGGGSWATTCR